MTEPPKPPEPQLEHAPAPALDLAPDWGCAEFRETIAWMRARWPELADEAEHPHLNALIAETSRSKRKQLRPLYWFKPSHKKWRYKAIELHLSARQMSAIEIGYAVHRTLKHPFLNYWYEGTFWLAFYLAVPNLIFWSIGSYYTLLEGSFFSAVLFPTLLISSIGWFIHGLIEARTLALEKCRYAKRALKRFHRKINCATGVPVENDNIKKFMNSMMLGTMIGIPAYAGIAFLSSCYYLYRSTCARKFIRPGKPRTLRSEFLASYQKCISSIEAAHEKLLSDYNKRMMGA